MSKAVLRLGYTSYVMDLRDAVTITEIMAQAEVYESKYAGGKSSHHIYANQSSELDGGMTIKLIPDEFYRMAKLAGAPTKE